MSSLHNFNAADSVQNFKWRHSWKHCYYERSLFDYMDHKHLSTDYSLKRLFNIIGREGAI